MKFISYTCVYTKSSSMLFDSLSAEFKTFCFSIYKKVNIQNQKNLTGLRQIDVIFQNSWRFSK
ncbi:hypothetical protein DLM76_08305 [Leptospira yasudae]|nr:hypothetical protein DLM76_08305 [Leptospira yasudae]